MDMHMDMDMGHRHGHVHVHLHLHVHVHLRAPRHMEFTQELLRDLGSRLTSPCIVRYNILLTQEPLRDAVSRQNDPRGEG